MDEKELKIAVTDLLNQKPEYEPTLRTIVEFEASVEPYSDDYWKHSPTGIMWDQEGLQIAPQKLTHLVRKGIVMKTFCSHQYKNYTTPDPAVVKEALDEWTSGRDHWVGGKRHEVIEYRKPDIPSDIFDNIVGYDKIKRHCLRVIGADEPVHTLLEGPPASAKTLFLREIERLPGSEYAYGSGTTGVGLREQLMSGHIMFVLVDELDKMDKDDMNALLSLCGEGRVKVIKHNLKRDVFLPTRAFVACNTTRRFRAEDLSRFRVYRFKPYKPGEFELIARRHLIMRFNTDPDVADHIATKLALLTSDIREAERVAKLCKTKEDVDEELSTMFEYDSFRRNHYERR